MILFWTAVFIISLVALVKSADWLLEAAEKMGFAFGLSPFVVGVVIVGFGTSLPELASSLAAVFEGATEIVTANAVGSNIANILLVVGISALIARKLVVTKDLIDLELPLLALATVLFLGVVWDKEVTIIESILLLFGYGTYLLYTLTHHGEDESSKRDVISQKEKLKSKDILLFLVGGIGLVLGAKYVVESVITLSSLLNIGTGVLTITAVALGTSLPELLVSIKAALKGKSDIALGNIFGSNVFNLLVVVGIPGLFSTLSLGEQTFSLGLPVLAIVTFIFILSGISRRIHVWEGAMYLILYILFIGKLLGFL